MQTNTCVGAVSDTGKLAARLIIEEALEGEVQVKLTDGVVPSRLAGMVFRYGVVIV